MKKNKHILIVEIVEDEVPMTKILSDKFNAEGFKVLKARNGEEGLKIALLKHPDIIILDIIMPRMDGITMLKELRKDGWGKNAKVILLTVLDHYKEAEKLANEGQCDYLVKSDWNLEDLIKKVRERMEEK